MPVRNAAKTLERTIESIRNQSYANIMEIILAIGPSNDGTRTVAEEHSKRDSRINIVENKSGGTARGLNLAAERATGAYLVRVDSHCQLPEDYVRVGVEKIIETGAATGVFKWLLVKLFSNRCSYCNDIKIGVGNAKFHYGGAEGPVDTVYLGIFDTILFRELAGFDENLVRNQDYELNIRIRQTGRLVWFTPDLVVRYFPRSNISQLFSQFFQYGSWKRKVIFKHPKSLKLRQLAPPSLIIMLLISVILFALLNAWYLVPSLAYFLICIAVSTFQKGVSVQIRAYLSLVFTTMHIAWGLGFLFGRTKIPEFCNE